MDGQVLASGNCQTPSWCKRCNILQVEYLPNGSRLDSIPNARGHFNYLEVEDGRLIISGWLLLPELALDSFKVFVDGKLAQEAYLEESDEIGEIFPFVPHARRSVFQASV